MHKALKLWFTFMYCSEVTLSEPRFGRYRKEIGMVCIYQFLGWRPDKRLEMWPFSKLSIPKSSILNLFQNPFRNELHAPFYPILIANTKTKFFGKKQILSATKRLKSQEILGMGYLNFFFNKGQKTLGGGCIPSPRSL